MTDQGRKPPTLPATQAVVTVPIRQHLYHHCCFWRRQRPSSFFSFVSLFCWFTWLLTVSCLLPHTHTRDVQRHTSPRARVKKRYSTKQTQNIQGKTRTHARGFLQLREGVVKDGSKTENSGEQVT